MLSRLNAVRGQRSRSPSLTKRIAASGNEIAGEHPRPQRPSSFWSAPKIKRSAASGDKNGGRKEESRITCMRKLRINQSKITGPQPSEQTTRVAPTHTRRLQIIHRNCDSFGGFRKNVSPELTISYS